MDLGVPMQKLIVAHLVKLYMEPAQQSAAGPCLEPHD
jgi:hypothetical protein